MNEPKMTTIDEAELNRLREAEAGAAVMREALQDALTCLDGARYEGGEIFKEEPYALQKKALSTGAGRELLEEVERLRQWKKEALEIEARWDNQAVARLLELQTGEDIRSKIQPKIEALLSELSTLRPKVKAAEEMAEAAKKCVCGCEGRCPLDSALAAWQEASKA